MKYQVVVKVIIVGVKLKMTLRVKLKVIQTTERHKELVVQVKVREQIHHFRGKGYRTIEECRTLCDNDNKCVGFDYARPRGDKYDCYLHYTNPPSWS